VIMTDQLVKAARNDDELFAMLAHAVGHVEAATAARPDPVWRAVAGRHPVQWRYHALLAVAPSCWPT
jgi:hypothetical protein